MAGYIGRALPRLEDAPLLRGEGRFTDDWTLPGQVFAAFVRSPHAHAQIQRIEFGAAAASSGVVAVLTGVDLAAPGREGIAHAPVPADVLDWQRPAFGAFDGRLPLDEPQPPMPIDRVRYPGEAVAVVIAESAAAAVDAAELVDVSYTGLPAVAEARSAIADGAPLLTPAAPNNVALVATFGSRDQVDGALRSAAVVVEHEFTVQRVANAQLEPRAVLASYDPASGAYLMIAGSQGVVRQRAALAAALNVPLERVRVISPDVGGGFGPRTSLYPEQVVVAVAAAIVGRPVRWTSSRTEAFLADHQGRDAHAKARLGLQADGRIAVLDVDLLFNVGAYAASYVPLNNSVRILPSVYHIPLTFARVRGVLTNTVPTGPFRGAGRPEAIFVLERLFDLAAERMGIDRLELRRRNLVQREQLPYRTSTGLTYDSGDFVGNMERAQQLSDWRGFDARRVAAARRGKLAGIGVANYVEAPVGAPHERVVVSVQSEGMVEVTVGTQSSGQGHATTFAQVVAELLDCAPDQVRLVTGDTQRVVTGGGTHSDRSMRLAGTLLVEACRRVRDLALEYDPDGRLDLFELARRHPLQAEASFAGRLPAHPTGAAACEVEIDPETGSMELTGYACVDDVGRPINPLIVEGQVHGGIVQGLGQALGEAIGFDTTSAQVLTSSLLDYPMPRAAELPAFRTELAEDPTESNPLRVKGGGESGITPSLPVVVNAAVDALRELGVTDLEMPLTPARVWSATEQARRRGSLPRDPAVPPRTPPG